MSNLEQFVGIFESDKDLLPLLKYLYKAHYSSEDITPCQTIQKLLLKMRDNNNIRKNTMTLIILYGDTFPLPYYVKKVFWCKDTPCPNYPPLTTMNENQLRSAWLSVNPIRALLMRIEKLEAENTRLSTLVADLSSKIH